MKDSYFANNNIKTFTDDSKMFGRGKIGKRKLLEAKSKKSRAKVPLIDPQPMQAPPAPASSVELDCQHCGFKYVFKGEPKIKMKKILQVLFNEDSWRNKFQLSNPKA